MEGSVATDVGAHDTPLIDAVRHDRVADVAALLAGGADVNEPKTDGGGATALMVACQYGHTEVVTTLIAANANVRQVKNNGGTALKTACQYGHTEVITALIAANADVNQANNEDVTPLYVACQEGHTGVVTTLLAANADVNQVRTSNGATPLFIASQEGPTSTARRHGLKKPRLRAARLLSCTYFRYGPAASSSRRPGPAPCSPAPA